MEKNEHYINGFCARDICAYCNIEWNEKEPLVSEQYKIVKALYLWKEREEKKFYFPAAIFQPIWFAYHNMFAWSLLSSIFVGVCYTFFQLVWGHFFREKYIWLGIINAWAIGSIFAGKLAIPALGKKIFRYLEECGLKNRLNEANTELEELLKKRGKTSVARVVFFLIIQFLLYECTEGILVMLMCR